MNSQDVLRVSLLFWFLALCALGSAVFCVLAIHNRDRQLAFSAAAAFILLCAAAAIELVGF